MQKKIIALSALLLVFAISAVLAVCGTLENAELSFAKFLNSSASHNRIMKYFTDIGEFSGVFSAIVLLLLVPVTRKNIGLPVGLTVLAGWIIQMSAKLLIGRERPTERLLEITGYSFPSGHAMNSTTLYISVLLLCLKFCKNNIQKAVLAAGCILIPFMIGISRVYFNVHFITDVIGGWCLGAAFAVAGSMVVQRVENGKTKGQN